MTRGAHQRDTELFAAEWHPALAAALDELSWLRTRGYTDNAALKLVGDRHRLRSRQRAAIARMACSDQALATRRSKRVAVAALRGQALAIDGFNCLITCECAARGALVLVGRDGAHRDLASVHGKYKVGSHTHVVLDTLASLLRDAAVERVVWMLDRPVSNSGRLRGAITRFAEAQALPWTVELHNNPDTELSAFAGIVATSDQQVLDRAAAWIDLPAAFMASAAPQAWRLDLHANPRP